MPCWTSHMCGSWQNKVSARQCWSLGMTTWMFVLSFTWERYWWGVDGSTCSNTCLKSRGSKCLKSNDADYYSRELLCNWILNTMGPLRLTDKMAVSLSLWEIMSRGKLQMWPLAHCVIALHPRWWWIPSQRSWDRRCSTCSHSNRRPHHRPVASAGHNRVGKHWGVGFHCGRAAVLTPFCSCAAAEWSTCHKPAEQPSIF